MKAVAALAILASAGAVAAQGFDLPQCARACATSFLRGGDCGTDPKCICSDKSFLSDIACCLADDCSAEDQERAVSFALSFCRNNGVTDLPSSVSCATAAPSTTATSGASASSSSAAATEAESTTTAASSGSASAPTSSATETSSNIGPRQTAAVGLGAIGGIIAAAALL
ncbi:hypothetical protein VTH06DRAFT_2450 [Thermothelomyces fergusii]